jgi:ubiquinone biosynthesis protein UbiJ
MGEQWRSERLRQISELCSGQAFDHHKSVAEVMAEHIIVKEEAIAALTTERDRLRGEVAALEEALDDLREEAWTRGEQEERP